MLKSVINFSILLLFTALSNGSKASPRNIGERIFEHLTGTSLPPNDPRTPIIERLVAEGKLRDVAHLASADRGFYNVTLANWAAKMSTKEENSFTVFNDLQAMLIGIVRDDQDARLMLTGDFRYQAKSSVLIPAVASNSNAHFENIGQKQLDLNEVLEKVSPQNNYGGEAAGVLTSRAWGQSFYSAGTNRRAVDYAFREFLCIPITQWRDPSLPETWIRRDVDRAPGGDFHTFQTVCRTCHAAMDGLAGAFAKIDFQNNALTYISDGVAPKYNQNTFVYPEGHKTDDNAWINQAIYHHNEQLGWRGPTSGTGIRSFGMMLANSQQFKRCMVSRVVREVCRKDAASMASDVVSTLATNFETSGYNLRSLFEEVATQESCLHTDGKPDLNMLNHRQLYNSLANKTKNDPTEGALISLFDADRRLLPENGDVGEVSNPTLFATTSAASFFCRKMIAKDSRLTEATQRVAHRQIDFRAGPSALTSEKVAALAKEYAQLFYARDPLPEEIEIINNLILESAVDRPDTAAETLNILTLACTAMTASLENITY